ncbi:hypothetical protein [Intestinimonas massiliensis (ex Afouda et al. 2020)]|uniref:hypothetical protein n=1 Tax=Intestinimonas massiliensis (ex Afouda et al. 2020) TaxID=1673721 RepID=UPI00103014D5|nr:hypothetical protein [Intestinimonas massiliensis (ex Afouda et al. 2020)]
MKRCKYIPLLLLALLLLSACGSSPRIQAEARRLAAVQLGKLDGEITKAEHQQVTDLLERLIPLRQAREVRGEWEPSGEEERLVTQLNQLYEDCTRRYLGDLGGWSADEEKMEALAEYQVKGNGTLELTEGKDDYRALWQLVDAMLPQGSLDAFDRFTVFTDGEEEILAYVVPTDDDGARWELAVDPMDTEDAVSFAETVFHEYCHYLTLNNKQVTYDRTPSYGCYAESDLTAYPNSYLNTFYHTFWKDYLDDRRADPETYGFYLRHADDFLTGYAATSPSEDIAESFAYFVLYDKAEGDGIPAQKQNFFYAYPELVAFRDQARAKMGL